MKKRALAVVMTAAMLAASLAGCGNASETPGAQEAQTQTGSSGEGGKRVLTFNTNSWAAPQNVEGLQELFDQWEEENNAELEMDPQKREDGAYKRSAHTAWNFPERLAGCGYGPGYINICNNLDRGAVYVYAGDGRLAEDTAGVI